MSGQSRPDPDELLRRVQHIEAEEASKSRAKLKIFLGAAAGVGKTYHMLEEAQSLKKNGIDVVIALVETHGRPETEALLDGLETIPLRRIDHEGIELLELDLDAVLARRPAIALVDELAHTNAPGSRHAKRYQDVEEMLDLGISVYTTLNIQHIESLNDVVHQITGVRVEETLPDRILERADEIEVVDLPPEELLQRFKEGKVYVPSEANMATRRFFRKGNLLGLRELALRYAAHKVDEDMRSYMEDHGILGPWPAGSRVLVCLSTNPISERLVRIGHAMSSNLDAEWFAVHVESPQEPPHVEVAEDQLERNIRLAEDLGAKVQVLGGRNIAEEILSFARAHNITLIVVGLPRRSLWNRWLRGSIINDIVNHSGQIHVLVIGGTEADQKEVWKGQGSVKAASKSAWRPLYLSLISVVAATGFCWVLQGWLGLISIALVLLLPVVYSGMALGRRAGLLTSILAVIALDFFFVPPQISFSVSDLRYIALFSVFIMVGVATSLLADLVRWQGVSARQRERFVSALYSFSRDLMAAESSDELLRYAAKEIAETFGAEVLILLPDESGQLRIRAQMGERMMLDERKLGVATWVFQHGQPAGRGTETLSSATLFYLPLTAKEITVGVMGLGLGGSDSFLRPDQRRLLEAFAGIIALALVRMMPDS